MTYHYLIENWAYQYTAYEYVNLLPSYVIQLRNNKK